MIFTEWNVKKKKPTLCHLGTEMYTLVPVCTFEVIIWTLSGHFLSLFSDCVVVDCEWWQLSQLKYNVKHPYQNIT